MFAEPFRKVQVQCVRISVEEIRYSDIISCLTNFVSNFPVIFSIIIAHMLLRCFRIYYWITIHDIFSLTQYNKTAQLYRPMGTSRTKHITDKGFPTIHTHALHTARSGTDNNTSVPATTITDDDQWADNQYQPVQLASTNNTLISAGWCTKTALTSQSVLICAKPALIKMASKQFTKPPYNYVQA